MQSHERGLFSNCAFLFYQHPILIRTSNSTVVSGVCWFCNELNFKVTPRLTDTVYHIILYKQFFMDMYKTKFERL